MGIEMPVPAKPEGVDAEVWEQMLHAMPAEARHLIREGKFAAPTSGLCPGYAQANHVLILCGQQSPADNAVRICRIVCTKTHWFVLP